MKSQREVIKNGKRFVLITVDANERFVIADYERETGLKYRGRHIDTGEYIYEAKETTPTMRREETV